jgi:hypothetical protein
MPEADLEEEGLSASDASETESSSFPERKGLRRAEGLGRNDRGSAEGKRELNELRVGTEG